MAGDPAAQVPFNFFAGSVPIGYPGNELAFPAGYLAVITSVIVTWTEDQCDFSIIDAEGNIRFAPAGNPDNTPFPQYLNIECEMVIGGESGATCFCGAAGVYATIDGYAYAPIGGGIW